MLSMSVAGDDELECLDVDEDEPVSKSARNMEKSCENVSNKAITHSSDQIKGMNSIIKGQNEPHKRELTESSTIKAESIAIDKDTPNNLVDTISRLQRSLSKSTLPIVQLQSPMRGNLNMNTARTDSQFVIPNSSQGMIMKTNQIQSDFRQTSPQELVNNMHHKKDSHISMQVPQPQVHLSSNLYIPHPSQQQLNSSGMGKSSLLLPPNSSWQRLGTSYSSLQTIPNTPKGNSTLLTNYLGSLNPVQAPYLNTVTTNQMKTQPYAAEVQPIMTGSDCKTSLPFTTSYKSTLQGNHIQNTFPTISPMLPSKQNPPLHFTTTTSNLSLLHSLGSQVKCNGGQSLLNPNLKNNAIIITQKNDAPRVDWARNNQFILTSKDRRQIKTSVTILEKQHNGCPWQPPLKLPVGNAWGWQVNGFVNMFESAIYINLHGPRNMARSFMLPFKNILATTKKSQVAINAKQEIWPPSDDMLALCEDVSRWELHMCINPNTDIKATIIDPWKKTYLLTIPGKLLA